jgi:hypothetical protein
MISPSIRLAVLCAGGILVVGLLAWGIFARTSTNSANVTATPVSTPSPVITNNSGEPISELADQNVAVQPEPSTTAIPASSPGTNRLPLGVTKEATEYSKEVYQKLPGIKPPVINTDGRNLGPEALAALQSSPTPMPFPGTSFLAAQGSVSPMPFPKTLEQIRHSLQPSLSPSPAPPGN